MSSFRQGKQYTVFSDVQKGTMFCTAQHDIDFNRRTHPVDTLYIRVVIVSNPFLVIPADCLPPNGIPVVYQLPALQ